MTVLHITTVPISMTFLRGQVGFMKSRGMSVHALSSPGEYLEEFGRSEDVSMHAVDMTRRITPFRDLRALVRILQKIRVIRPAIVHAHTPKGGLLGMIAATLCGTRVRIYQMRGLPFLTAIGLKRRMLRFTEWVACRFAHVVISNSHSLRQVAINEHICAPEKITVFLGGSGNGVDAGERFNPAKLDPTTRFTTRARFGIPADAIVIGFVGRVVREKGIGELAASWQSLRKEYPKAHLLIVGPLESHDPIPSCVIESLKSDARVHLTGMDWNTPPLYAAMDLVALPTYREGFPNVPLEAGAMELPVVTTNVPGCIDSIEDGKTGILVPPRDSRALARAMKSYLDNPHLRRDHGEAARRRVLREFRQEAIWEAVYSEYTRLWNGGERFSDAEV